MFVVPEEDTALFYQTFGIYQRLCLLGSKLVKVFFINLSVLFIKFQEIDPENYYHLKFYDSR